MIRRLGRGLDCRPFGRGKAAKPDGVGETVFEVPFAD
jgi:hypothetical protein